MGGLNGIWPLTGGRGQGKGRLKHETWPSGLDTPSPQYGGKTWGIQENHKVPLSLVDEGDSDNVSLEGKVFTKRGHDGLSMASRNEDSPPP